MTSQAQALAPLDGVCGLIFFAFPLHPAGRPSDDRAAHLAAVTLPMLFLQGTKDPFAELGLLRSVVARLGGRATLGHIDQADHSFHVPAKTGRMTRPIASGSSPASITEMQSPPRHYDWIMAKGAAQGFFLFVERALMVAALGIAAKATQGSVFVRGLLEVLYIASLVVFIQWMGAACAELTGCWLIMVSPRRIEVWRALLMALSLLVAAGVALAIFWIVPRLEEGLINARPIP